MHTRQSVPDTTTSLDTLGADTRTHQVSAVVARLGAAFFPAAADSLVAAPRTASIAHSGTHLILVPSVLERVFARLCCVRACEEKCAQPTDIRAMSAHRVSRLLRGRCSVTAWLAVDTRDGCLVAAAASGLHCAQSHSHTRGDSYHVAHTPHMMSMTIMQVLPMNTHTRARARCCCSTKPYMQSAIRFCALRENHALMYVRVLIPSSDRRAHAHNEHTRCTATIVMQCLLCIASQGASVY